MEYLMTYGWAILIIAVVLAALFELGVFNPMTFAPKASPGSCQVVRPEGAGTTDFISLSGECNGELPQYVAQFNGQNSYIESGYSWNNGKSISVAAWFYLNYIPNNNAGIFSAFPTSIAYNGTIGIFPNGECKIQVWLTNTTLSAFADDSPYCVLPKTWYQVVGWINQSSHTYGLYINGKLNFTQYFSGTLHSSSNLFIGLFAPQGAYFPGQIANVQIYNTTLSSNDVQALYQEGIGGAPINIQNLVAWYPLNGNANDYSGNGNNGVASGVTYTSNWYSGYSAP